MNKRAFTLIELLITIVVIGIIMGLVLPSAIRVSNDNKTKIFEEYEKMMIEYALINSKKGNQVIVLDDLDELAGIIKKECSGVTGYVYKTSSSPIKYDAYLNCPNTYQTTGYSDSIYQNG